jgi:predicted transcriptional regulator of viral defense system
MEDVGRIDHDIHGSSGPGDREIAELAARQRGVVAYWQLAAMGFGRGTIEHRIRAGRLIPVRFGVYAVGHAALTWHGRCMAAVLSYGPRAVLSHRAAVALHELRPSSSPIIEVTVPERGRRPRAGIRLHRVRRLHPDDVTLLDGMPVTSLARTLLDFAEVARTWELERAIEEAERRGLFDLEEIERAMERGRGRRGLKALRAVLADFTAPPPTRNDFERDALEMCKEIGLGAPGVNVQVEGFEVDCFWPDLRLVVELDSRTHHERRSAFESDRIRDAELQLAGYRVLRITHRRFYRDRATVRRDLLRARDSAIPAALPA